jgi:hypothetical protein
VASSLVANALSAPGIMLVKVIASTWLGTKIENRAPAEDAANKANLRMTFSVWLKSGNRRDPAQAIYGLKPITKTTKVTAVITKMAFWNWDIAGQSAASVASISTVAKPSGLSQPPF